MLHNELSLENVTYKDTIPFVPPITHGKVVKVYDGDTLTVASRLPYPSSPLYRFQVRLAGIDCPEMKTKNESEKQVALLAKEFISSRVLNKMIELQNVETEKYGRLLARVYCDGRCINDELCEQRLAVAYQGGTKQSPEDWLQYYNSTK